MARANATYKDIKGKFADRIAPLLKKLKGHEPFIVEFGPDVQGSLTSLTDLDVSGGDEFEIWLRRNDGTAISKSFMVNGEQKDTDIAGIRSFSAKEAEAFLQAIAALPICKEKAPIIVGQKSSAQR